MTERKTNAMRASHKSSAAAKNGGMNPKKKPSSGRTGVSRPKSAAAGKKSRKKVGLLSYLAQSWFYRIYFGLLLVCAVALILGLNVLRGVMTEYEQTRPIYCAEEAFELVQSRDWAQIYALDESARALSGETAEQYAQYMQELTAGKSFTLKNVLSINDDERKYSVLADGEKFAELTLSPSGELTDHNFSYWKLSKLETRAMAASEYSITAPADSIVQVNGRTLTQADAVQTDIPTDASGNLPDGVIAPTMTKYAVKLSFGAPEFSATDRHGNAQRIEQADGGNYSVSISYDDDTLKAQCEEGVIKWGRRIAAYTTGDFSKSDLSGACINPSPARTYIRNMENQWAASHSGVDFENIQTYNYYQYSENCFSCTISFDYIVHYKQQDKSYPTLYTLYFYKQGGNFKLYSFTMN